MPNHHKYDSIDDETAASYLIAFSKMEKEKEKVIKNSRYMSQMARLVQNHQRRKRCDNCRKSNILCSGKYPCAQCQSSGKICCGTGFGPRKPQEKDIHPLPQPLNALSQVIQPIEYQCKRCQTKISSVWVSFGVDEWYCFPCILQKIHDQSWEALSDDERCKQCGIFPRAGKGSLCKWCMKDKNGCASGVHDLNNLKSQIVKHWAIPHCGGCTKPVLGMSTLNGGIYASLSENCLLKYAQALKRKCIAHVFDMPNDDTYYTDTIEGSTNEGSPIFSPKGYPRPILTWNEATREQKLVFMDSIGDFEVFKWDLADISDFFNLFPSLNYEMVEWIVVCLKALRSSPTVEDLITLCAFHFINHFVTPLNQMEQNYTLFLQSLWFNVEHYPPQTTEEEVIRVFAGTIGLLLDYRGADWIKHLRIIFGLASYVKDNIITFRASPDVNYRYLDQIFCLSFDILNKFLLFEEFDTDSKFDLSEQLNERGWSLFSGVDGADVIYGVDFATYDALIGYWKIVQKSWTLRGFKGVTGKSMDAYFIKPEDPRVASIKKQLRMVVRKMPPYKRFITHWYNGYHFRGYHECVYLLFKEMIGEETSDAKVMEVTKRIIASPGYQMKWLVNALLIMCRMRHYTASYDSILKCQKSLKYQSPI